VQLYEQVRRALTDEWQKTQSIQQAVERAEYAPAINDVAAMLRQLRRDGLAERVSKGLNGHYWRRAQ
jgi:hypothetical protein